MDDPVNPAKNRPTEAPCELQGLDAGELLARGMDTVRPSAGTSPWEPPTIEEVARLLPQYRIERLIGRGGMGAVYQGVQLNLDRPVAIKLLPAEMAADEQFVVRFEREARTLAKLQHSRIVTIYDFGRTAEGHLYFVMEHIDGTDLRSILRGPGLRPDQALVVVGQLCDALQAAHREGIVHRDIKPENVLITRDGYVKLADFGLARPPRQEGTPNLTKTDLVLGTPDYMAPEQRSGVARADARSDIFALGVMLYEMLTGQTPRGVFDPPSHKVPVDVRIDEVVLKALQAEPERRYQQASELKTAVERIRTTPLPAPTEAPAAAAPEKQKYLLPMVVSAAAVLLVAVAALLWSGRQGGAERARAPIVQAGMTGGREASSPAPSSPSPARSSVATAPAAPAPAPSLPAIAEIRLDADPEKRIEAQRGKGVRVDSTSATQFKVVPGLKDPRMVSFEPIDRPGAYLRHEDGIIWLHQRPDTLDLLFEANASFRLIHVDANRYRFEASGLDNMYIAARNDGVVVLAHNPVPEKSIFILQPVERGVAGESVSPSGPQPIPQPVTESEPAPSSPAKSAPDSPAGRRATQVYNALVGYHWAWMKAGQDAAPLVVTFDWDGHVSGGWTWRPIYKTDGETVVECIWGDNGHQYLKLNESCDGFEGFDSQGRLAARGKRLSAAGQAVSAGEIAAAKAAVAAEAADAKAQPATPVARRAAQIYDSLIGYHWAWMNAGGTKPPLVVDFNWDGHVSGGWLWEMLYKPDGETLVHCNWNGNGHQYLRMNEACDAFDAFDSDGVSKVTGKRLGPVDLPANLAGVALAKAVERPGAPPSAQIEPLLEPSLNAILAPLQENPPMPRVAVEKVRASLGAGVVRAKTTSLQQVYQCAMAVCEALTNAMDQRAESRAAAASSGLVPSLSNGGSIIISSGRGSGPGAGGAGEAIRRKQKDERSYADRKAKGLSNFIDSAAYKEWVTRTAGLRTNVMDLYTRLVQLEATEPTFNPVPANVAANPAAPNAPVPNAVAANVVARNAVVPNVAPANPAPAPSQPTAAPPAQEAKTDEFVNSLGMKFVPAGTPGVLFCIWDTRVKDFAQFIELSGYDMSKGEKAITLESDGKGGHAWKHIDGNWRDPHFPQDAAQTEDHPVVCVSWKDAKAFCAWLTKKERDAGVITADQSYRLPMDHEWSTAVGIGDREDASASPASKNGKLKGVFPWGTEWPPPAGSGNFMGEESKVLLAGTAKGWTVIDGYNDGFPCTSPVGSFPPNRYGLYDMAGNVWQVTEDRYDPKSADRVQRGGCWGPGQPTILQSSCRRPVTLGDRFAGRGFRVVLVTLEGANPPK